MGNVCSSSKKKKKDNSSQKSEESLAYQCNTKKDTTSKELTVATKPQGTTNHNTEETIRPAESVIKEPEKAFEEADSITSTPQTATAPQEVTLKQIPHHLSILQGRLPNDTKVERDQKVVIYILTDNSSESKSNKAVIHSLHSYLEQKCQSKGFEFLISDIHECQDVSLSTELWASNPLEAKGGHEECANCLAEISRHVPTAYVLPVLLLGSSLGTPMLPLAIESQDFETILNEANLGQRELLEKWYEVDNSYQPVCHTLRSEKAEGTSPAETTLELTNLLNAMIKLFPDDLKDSYMTTVVEQEINNTVLMSAELAKRCIWIYSGPACNTVPEDASPLELEIFRRINKINTKLKTHLSEKNSIRILPSMLNMEEELTAVFENLLDKAISAVFEEYTNKNSLAKNTNGIAECMLREIQLVAQYSNLLAQNSSNAGVLEEIKRYIENKSTEYPFIVTGSHGIGKSVLVSKIVENIFKWNREIHLVVRYTNLSVASSDITSLIGSIANQLSALVYGCHCKSEHTVESYGNIIKTILEANNTCFVIIIDSLDEILGGVDLSWLPQKLKSKSKVILTATQHEDGQAQSDAIKRLKEHGIPQSNFVQLNSYTRQQWNDMLCVIGGDYYVSNVFLRLPREWKELDGKTPFHAKALLWLAWLGEFTTDCDNIGEILRRAIETVELKFNNGYLELLLLIIALSKWGIRESDCLAIFRTETKLELEQAFRTWSKFCWLMRPMLLYLRCIRIADGIFREAVVFRYAQSVPRVHKLLVNYFEQQPFILSPPKEAQVTHNTEKCFKLPYHFLCALEEASAHKKAELYFNSHYFTQLDWILHKVVATGSISLLNDIYSPKQLLADDGASYMHIAALKSFLQTYSQELYYDGRQFLTLFKSFLKAKAVEENYDSSAVISNWLSTIDSLQFSHLVIINKDSQDTSQSEFNGYDALVYIPTDDNLVASLSTEREEICIWDVRKCERLKEFRNIPQPTAMCPVGNFEAAVLCRREIKVIDLNNGELKVTLKGVMNQKMPYFGLHDEKHLVCLSRNRMYVNLMNLESGDCVTTFKAGEDRFLNSLLVSGDGRILVCGDETQKPFPLLVWHLSQKKLLYDLRIPHHDFITSLSAITHEGSYVCVVAKEVNEPTPNFIVVYDLQSGTLFKKWKPTCNTVSLAISQVNVCVIAGLDDAKILVLDLVTGNCRSTLVGHNAPVTFLKLDPLGKVLLSRDSEGRDSSVRLWELSTGTHLAVYTPPNRIASCELLPNGTHVVLSLKNCSNLLVLALKNYREKIPNEALS